MDASLVQQLKDPLTHMIRNAVDHAIETADVRRGRGKDPVATITLAASHDGGSVVIEVRDDGAGFDRERILARGRERGMIASGAVLSDEEIDALVFTPGFSTAETVTEISGRGVGMDIVARAVAAMRGTVHVDSTPGVGTKITMRLPLTLAILGGLAGLGLAYAGIRALVAAAPEGLPRLEEIAIDPIVLLFADDLIGEMQAVIKPLGKVFRDLAGVSASTIFPDGRVGLILDIAALVRRATKERAA
jgi:two-component system chemotaxis sensor kinase CheA